MKISTIRAGTLFECSDCDFTSPVKTELEKHSRAWNHGSIGSITGLKAETHKYDIEGEVNKIRTEVPKSEIVTIRAGSVYECCDCGFTTPVKTELEKHSRAWDHGTIIIEGKEPRAETPKSDNELEQCEGSSEDLFHHKCPMCPFQASDKSLYDKHLIDVHEIVEICNNESGEVGLGEDSGIWDTEMEDVEVEAKKEALIEQMMLKQLEKNIRNPKKSKKSKSKRARQNRVL